MIVYICCFQLRLLITLHKNTKTDLKLKKKIYSIKKIKN